MTRPTQTITIGAASNNDFVIDKPTVSSNHAVLTSESNQLKLEDLGSSNGTYIADRTDRISKVTVDENTIVRFADIKVKVGEILASVPPRPRIDPSPSRKRISFLIPGITIVLVALVGGFLLLN